MQVFENKGLFADMYVIRRLSFLDCQGSYISIRIVIDASEILWYLSLGLYMEK